MPIRDAVDTMGAALPGSIRSAEPRDRAQIARLLAGSGIDAQTLAVELDGPSQHGHVLVFDLDGAVRAVAHVQVVTDAAPRGWLQLLVVDPAVAEIGASIEDRMLAVAAALCEAYGCPELEVAAAPQRPGATARLGRVAGAR